MIGVNDGFFTFVDTEEGLINALSESQTSVMSSLQEILKYSRGDLNFLSDIARIGMDDVRTINKKVSSYYFTLVNVGKIYQFKAREGTAKIMSQD